MEPPDFDFDFDGVGVVDVIVVVRVGFVLGCCVVTVVVGVDVEVVVVWDGVLVVPAGGGQTAVPGGQAWDRTTLVIGSLTGSVSDVSCVPGGTFWKMNCWPPATVTVTVQPSAEASGIAASPSTVTKQPAVTPATVSLRRLNTVVNASRGVPRLHPSQLRSQIGSSGRYWLPPSFAIRNRRSSGCLLGNQRTVT